jgi:biopolymer transport protein ExbB
MTSLFAGIPSWIIPAIIGFISIISLTLIIERIFTLTQGIQSISEEEQNSLLALIKQEQYDDALSFCDLRHHPSFRVASAIIQTKLKNLDIKFSASQMMMLEQSKLERFLPSLGTISTVAPLIGLLGTVTGMIKSFRAFEQSSAQNTQLMGGIDEALITTALGLIVAIPSLVMYNFFVRKVQLINAETELFMNIILKEVLSQEDNNEKQA